MKKYWIGAAALVGLLAIAAVGWYGLRQDSTPAPSVAHAGSKGAGGKGGEERPVSVVAEPVTGRSIPIVLTGLGTVQGYQTVTVRSRIDGQIIKLSFKEGQEVKAGDLLVQLDSRAAEASLAQAVANLHRGQSQLDTAVANLGRIQQLGESGFASAQTVETANSQVAQLRATIEADAAAVKAVQTQLSFTQIRAPISGRTGLRTVDEGNLIRAADVNGIVTISQITPVAVIFSLPAGEVVRLNRRLDELTRQGRPLTVLALDGSSGATLDEGLIETVDNQIDTTTGTIKLKARFPNPRRLLWPGQFVSVRVELAVVKNALTLPDAAIQQGPNGNFVFVVTGEPSDLRVSLRPIKVSRTVGGLTVIESGLAAGESVVTVGQFRLKDGARVTLN
ncbi:MAG: efflux RND transporter periplasmic adaptor subunit [Alphaproteobacteria bacterium]|nr:efflux RND transporter periplasmic adaptor subunit [Alphaproteobacteria bacterium]